MRLLLMKDVRKLGHIGDIVEVSRGYARNYLLPQRLATDPTEENIKAIEEDKKIAAAERARKLKEFEALAEKIKDVTITIEAAANPEGTLYGGVHAKEIAEALHAQGFPVLPDHIVLDTPIRTLDNRTIKLEFTDEISAEVKLWVVRAGAAEHEHAAANEPDEPDDDDRDDYEDEDDDFR